jgi:hypothetical protein
VSLTRFRQQFKALIRADHAKVTLNNVDFSYIQVAACASCGVIISSVCEVNVASCSSLAFTGGKVRYLNYGYEFRSEAVHSGFLYSNAFSSVVISQVDFSFNAMLGRSSTSVATEGLLNLERFSYVVLEECSFSYNLLTAHGLLNIQSLNLPGSSGLSAQDYTQLVHVAVRRCTFNNNASLQGAAVGLIKGKTDALNIEVTGCHFTGNAAAVSSQAMLHIVSLTAAWQDVSLKDSLFTDNLSSTYVLSLTSTANLTLERLTFTANGFKQGQDLNSRVLKGFIDAGLYVSLYIDGVTASQSSGPLSIKDSAAVKLNELVFEGNIATTETAGLIVTASAVVQANLLSFSTNSLLGKGCAAASFDLTQAVTLSHLAFTANSALGEDTDASIACLYGEADVLTTLTDSTFTNNRAIRGVLISTQRQALVSRVSFKSNSATKSGGALLLESPSSAVSIALDIQDSSFEANSADAGGAVAIASKTQASGPVKLTLSQSTFSRNKASLGSAVYVDSSQKLVEGSLITSCTFTLNESSGQAQGGTIDIAMTTGTLTLVNSKFSSNSASFGSAVMSRIGGPAATVKLVIKESSFEGQTKGSVILSIPRSAEAFIEVSDCSFTANLDTCIELLDTHLKATKLSFVYNSATYAPAVQAANSMSSLEITSSSFESNSATTHSGAVYLTNYATLNCTDCDFYNNTAGVKAGALTVERSSVLNCTQCSFRANRAEGQASVVLVVDSTDVLFRNSKFLENEVTDTGTMMLISAKTQLHNCTFRANRSVKDSPGIVLNMSVLKVTQSSFASQQ